MKTKKELFGKINNTPIYLFTLSNGQIKVKITNFGGIITKILVPDQNGKVDNVALGFKNLRDYRKKNNPYFGAIIGRFANRIAKGKFVLKNKKYQLAINNGQNHLHGGLRGFDKVIWQINKTRENILELFYLSRDGEENYPGNLEVTVKFSLTDKNELIIDYYAKTDKTTIVNLTNHGYFNLAGVDDILEHELYINANKFTPIDKTSIPTGKIASVKNIPFDFTKPKQIGQQINDKNQQLKFGNGYDHNFVLNKKPSELSLAARVYEPNSRRILEVFTTQPGIQLYTGNFLPKPRSGFALETQHFPDSPNKPQFPSVILRPNKKFHETTIYKFSIKKDN